jgi:TolB-like protein
MHRSEGSPVPDIFLSYNREDVGVAKLFAGAFAREGLEVWWDQTLRSGETYDEVTEAALRGAKAVVVLWSPRSVVSHWVRAEATIAHRAKTLVPATIEPCDKPVMFELTQTADLSHWRGETSDPAWQAFLRDVLRMSNHTASAVSAARERSSASPAPQNGRPLLAIMPFLNRSRLPDGDEVAEEMVEDLAAALSTNPWMEVIAANATTAYRSVARDFRQIGEDLGARYLLEGKIRSEGDDLRLTVQLVAAEAGKVLWTEKFSQTAADAFADLEELIAEVTAQLSVQVLKLEVDRAVRDREGGSAWEAYMRGVAHYNRATQSGYEAAAGEARHALEIDANSDFAYGILLTGQGMLLAYRGEDPELEKELFENLRRARSIDPDSPSVLTGCAAAYSGLRKPLDALPFAERAVAKYPKLDWSRASYGIVLLQLGRAEDGLAELEAAQRLCPDTVTNHTDAVWQSVGHLQAGRIDLALEAANRAVRLLVSPESLILQIIVLVVANDWDCARETMRRLRNIDPDVQRAQVENLVRYFHCGSAGVDKYADFASRLWDECMGKTKA